VVESPVSEARMRDMFKAVDAVIRTHKDVGEYNQTIRGAPFAPMLDLLLAANGGPSCPFQPWSMP
jgi:hypothetical protein